MSVRKQADHDETAGTAPPREHVAGTRTGRFNLALAAAMAFVVIILVFILENLQSVKVSFFGADWRIPLGVDLLLAAVLGGLIMFFAGSLRVMQLRRAARGRASTPR